MFNNRAADGGRPIGFRFALLECQDPADTGHPCIAVVPVSYAGTHVLTVIIVMETNHRIHKEAFGNRR